MQLSSSQHSFVLEEKYFEKRASESVFCCVAAEQLEKAAAAIIGGSFETIPAMSLLSSEEREDVHKGARNILGKAHTTLSDVYPVVWVEKGCLVICIVEELCLQNCIGFHHDCEFSGCSLDLAVCIIRLSRTGKGTPVLPVWGGETKLETLDVPASL
eukprot:3762417-Rhodomonas_salina.2